MRGQALPLPSPAHNARPHAMKKLLLGTALAFLAAGPASADLLVTNVKGVRATADRKIERFTGLLVGDDGKVKRVLHGEMFKLPAGTRVLNGGGKVLMPGLIDAHGHVM